MQKFDCDQKPASHFEVVQIFNSILTHMKTVLKLAIFSAIIFPSALLARELAPQEAKPVK